MAKFTRSQAALIAATECFRGDLHRIFAIVRTVESGRELVDGLPDQPRPAELLEPYSLMERIDHWDHRLRQLTVRERNVGMVSVDSVSYPRLLSLTPDPPAFLFLDGRLESRQDAFAMAIVGSRRATRKGELVAREIGAEAARRGVTVVSGLARGIDSAAHLGAIEAGGRTIAVLGSGIDVIVPPANVELAPRIRSSGYLVSQFPPGSPPTPANFPLRNRVVSGLSLVSLLVEGEEVSGTRDEAQHALSQGRLVLAWGPSFGSASWIHEFGANGRVVIVNSSDAVFDAVLKERDRMIGASSGGEVG